LAGICTTLDCWGRKAAIPTTLSPERGLEMDRHSQQLVLGAFFLAVAALELVIGTAVSASKLSGFHLRRRKDSPGLYWVSVSLTAVIGLFGIWASVYA
jgi:hypothetical protein